MILTMFQDITFNPNVDKIREVQNGIILDLMTPMHLRGVRIGHVYEPILQMCIPIKYHCSCNECLKYNRPASTFTLVNFNLN